MKGTDELVLYLDYDGCLHHSDVFWSPKNGFFLKAPERYTLFQHVPLLEEVLQPYPLLRIVLSTSWAHSPECGYSKAVNQLSPALQKQVIDATHYEEPTFLAQLPRGRQVLQDVAKRKPRAWLALDDLDEGWGMERDKLVLTHQYEGIGNPVVLAELKQKLAEMCN